MEGLGAGDGVSPAPGGKCGRVHRTQVFMQWAMSSALTPALSPRRGRNFREQSDIQGSVTFPARVGKSLSLSLGREDGRFGFQSSWVELTRVEAAWGGVGRY
jgi:hypothetical protein